jgi:hypothetical protein
MNSKYELYPRPTSINLGAKGLTATIVGMARPE